MLLYEISKIGKSREAEGRLVVARGWKKWVNRVFFWGDKCHLMAHLKMVNCMLFALHLKKKKTYYEKNTLRAPV